MVGKLKHEIFHFFHLLFYQSNPETSSTEDYYRITLYDEFLSHVISELEARFTDSPSHSSGLLYLLPKESVSLEVADDVPGALSQAVHFYKDDLPHSQMFSIEYRMWVRKWKQYANSSTDVPMKLVDALKMCSATEFPNIVSLLKLALTLPITTCESERSFSQLKLVKTCIRSTMTDTRLNGLALMKINRDVTKFRDPQTKSNNLCSHLLNYIKEE